MGHETSYPLSNEFEAAPTISPAELSQLLDEHTTVMFEPGVPGYETSLVVPVPPKARRSLIKEAAQLKAEDSDLETVDTDWPMPSS
jgi:hypothetical protein